MLGTPAAFFIISLCLLCFFLCFFFLVLSLFGFLPGCVSGPVTMHSLLAVLSPCLQVCLFIKTAKKLQNHGLAERFAFSTEATLRGAVLPNKGLQAQISAQEAAAGLALSRAVLILPCTSDRNLRNTRVISRGKREQCPNPELMKPPQEHP